MGRRAVAHIGPIEALSIPKPHHIMYLSALVPYEVCNIRFAFPLSDVPHHRFIASPQEYQEEEGIDLIR